MGDQLMPAFYVFNTQQAAENAMANINSHAVFPIRGRYRGQPAPDGKAKTERWADEVTQLKDGRFAFPKIPDPTLDAYNIPENDRAAFRQAFGPKIEELTAADFPAPVEQP